MTTKKKTKKKTATKKKVTKTKTVMEKLGFPKKVDKLTLKIVKERIKNPRKDDRIREA